MNKNIPPNFLFPTNFRNKRNVKRLIKDFYIQGYGIAVYLLEILAETEEHKYPLNDIDLIADELKVSIPTLQEIIKSYGLFEIIQEGEYKFFSPPLNQWLEPYTFGCSHKGDDTLSAFQIEGGSNSSKDLGWRQFIIENIDNLVLLDSKFDSIRDGYNPNDSRMSEIYITI